MVNPQVVIIPLDSTTKIPKYLISSIKEKKILIAAINNKPFDIIDNLLNMGFSLAYQPIDTEKRFYEVKNLFHQFYSDCHDLYIKNVPKKYHKWYWITDASHKLGPIIPECLFTALFLYIFQLDILGKYPNIECVYIIGENPYIKYINFSIKTSIIPASYTSYKVRKFQKVTIAFKFVVKSILNFIYRVKDKNKNTGIDFAFLIGNYWKKSNSNREIDMYFDSIPSGLREENFNVETISNTLLLYNYNKNCDIDKILNGKLSDVFFAFHLYYKITRSLKKMFIDYYQLYKNNTKWMKDLSLYKYFLLRNSKILFIGLILYREYHNYIRVKKPKVICFYDEIGYSRKVLQLAVNDSDFDKKPITIAFQHGWVYYTRFSHNFIVDKNEITNPFPTADFYFVYNKIAKDVYSELSNHIQKKNIIVTGMYRIEEPIEDLYKIYSKEMENYDIKILYIDSCSEYTRQNRYLLEKILSYDKIALIIKPHPNYPSDLKIIEELNLKKKPTSKLFYSKDFHLETIIKISDAILLNDSTVFLNAIYMNKMIIQAILDSKRLDGYGIKEGLKNMPGFYSISSTNEISEIIDIIKNKTYQKINYLESGVVFIPSLMGYDSSVKIINYMKNILSYS